MFEASKGRLKVVGRAGVGIDNVDLQAATEVSLDRKNYCMWFLCLCCLPAGATLLQKHVCFLSWCCSPCDYAYPGTLHRLLRSCCWFSCDPQLCKIEDFPVILSCVT